MQITYSKVFFFFFSGADILKVFLVCDWVCLCVSVDAPVCLRVRLAIKDVSYYPDTFLTPWQQRFWESRWKQRVQKYIIAEAACVDILWTRGDIYKPVNQNMH